MPISSPADESRASVSAAVPSSSTEASIRSPVRLGVVMSLVVRWEWARMGWVLGHWGKVLLCGTFRYTSVLIQAIFYIIDIREFLGIEWSVIACFYYRLHRSGWSTFPSAGLTKATLSTGLEPSFTIHPPVKEIAQADVVFQIGVFDLV